MLKSNTWPSFSVSINAVSEAMFFQAYCPFTVRSYAATDPSSVSPVLPSSLGAPTNTELSIMQTPLPKLSSAVTLSVVNLSSMTKCELYIVAV